MSERMQDRTTGVLIAILIAGAVALVAYAYNHHYGDSSSKKPDHSQSRISSPSGTTILVIDITILAIQMKAKMMYIMLIALRLVQMAQDQSVRANLAIGKSLTETVTV